MEPAWRTELNREHFPDESFQRSRDRRDNAWDSACVSALAGAGVGAFPRCALPMAGKRPSHAPSHAPSLLCRIRSQMFAAMGQARRTPLRDICRDERRRLRVSLTDGRDPAHFGDPDAPLTARERRDNAWDSRCACGRCFPGRVWDGVEWKEERGGEERALHALTRRGAQPAVRAAGPAEAAPAGDGAGHQAPAVRGGAGGAGEPAPARGAAARGGPSEGPGLSAGAQGQCVGQQVCVWLVPSLYAGESGAMGVGAIPSTRCSPA